MRNRKLRSQLCFRIRCPTESAGERMQISPIMLYSYFRRNKNSTWDLSQLKYTRSNLCFRYLLERGNISYNQPSQTGFGYKIEFKYCRVNYYATHPQRNLKLIRQVGLMKKGAQLNMQAKVSGIKSSTTCYIQARL